MSDVGVVLFHTTSAVFRAERLLQHAGIPSRLIPTPRELSSDCGLALQFEWEARSAVQALLQQAGVDYASLCLLPGSQAAGAGA